MISPKELNNLVDQLKIIARLSRVVRDEENYEKRKYANLIVEDALNHLVLNLEELKES